MRSLIRFFPPLKIAHLAATGFLLCAAPSALASIGVDAKVRWFGEPPAGVVAGQAFSGAVEVRTRPGAIVDDFSFYGIGWTQVRWDAPSSFSTGADGRRLVTFTAIPSDVQEPLLVTFSVGGRTGQESLLFAPQELEKLGRPSLAQLVDLAEPRRLGRQPEEGGKALPIRITGRFAYIRPDGLLQGADAMTVRVMDSDLIVDEEMASTITDPRGYFDISINWDDCDITGCDDPDIYLEFEASNGVVTVQRDNLLEDNYVWSTPEITDFTGGELHYGTIMPALSSEYPAVHISNSIVRAHRYIQQTIGTSTGTVDVQWPEDDGGNYYNLFFEEIHISAAASWNEGTHFHEYGHHFQNLYGAMSEPDYCNGTCDGDNCGHCVWCQENAVDAFNEGFGNWLGSALNRHLSTAYSITPLSAMDARYILETPSNCVDSDGAPCPCDPLQTEGFVGALMRDMEDDTNDDHDGPPNDCDIDAMSLGGAEILAVIRDDDPTNVLQFLGAFRARFPQHDQDLWSTTRNIDASYGFPLPTPVLESDPPACKLVNAGDLVSLAVSSPGSLLSFRWRRNGVELVDGSGVFGAATPNLSLFPVTAAMEGFYDCVVTTCDGSLSVTSAPAVVSLTTNAEESPLVGWGANTYGQVGNGVVTSVQEPVAVANMDNVMAAEGGQDHTIFLLSSGEVRTSGTNWYGQLGDGSWENSSVPKWVSGVSSAIAIASGGYHSLALQRDGQLKAWGDNGYGQLGDGIGSTNSNTPQAVALSGCIRDIAAGRYFSMALLSDGTVWTWGNASLGVLGRSITGSWTAIPGQVAGLSEVVQIAAGQYHALAVRADGSVWAWGYNVNGQLGDGTFTTRSTPAPVSALANVRQVSSRASTSYAVLQDGTLRAWGAHNYGSLGDGGFAGDRSTPVQVVGISTATQVSAGFGYALARLTDGTVRGWGYNGSGVLGVPAQTLSHSVTPMVIDNVSNATGVGTAWYTSYAFGDLQTVVAAPAQPHGPAKTILYGAAPNPFRSTTAFRLDLSVASPITLRIYNAAGRLVRTLVDGEYPPGRHGFTWDGKDQGGAKVHAGVFFARMTSPNLPEQVRKVALLR